MITGIAPEFSLSDHLIDPPVYSDRLAVDDGIGDFFSR
jgi:hypothetical protein